jgi:hypothetical protein
MMKHFKSRSLPTCHHCGVTGHIQPHCPQIHSQKSRIKKQEPKKGTSGTRPSKTHHAPRRKRKYSQRFVPPCRRCGKIGQNKSNYFKLTPLEPKDNHLYEGLFSMMKNVLSRLDKLNKVHKLGLRVKKAWVRKDEIIHPLRGSGLT